MKRKLVSLRRIAFSGFRNFFRNAWLSTAATAIMFVTLTIILTAVVLNRALTDTISDITSRVTVSVYLNNDISVERRNALQQALESNPNVKSIKYISKQEAVNIYKDLNRNDPLLIEGLELTGNDLPASFEVGVYDLSNIDSVTVLANSEDYKDIVEETSINERRQESIDNIARAQDYINIASIATAGVFAGISILVIFNTIRMAVFTRSDEIEIMKLIGATPWYIRGPFLFEASLYGVFAGILASAAIFSVLLGLGPRVDQQLLIGPTIDYFAQNWLAIFGLTILLGVVIGLISSLSSMARYLRLKNW